jgi:hypothetical protein
MAAFFSLKNELRRTLVAIDLIKDRQQLAGDGGVIEIVERIDPPVIWGTPGSENPAACRGATRSLVRMLAKPLQNCFRPM